MRRPKLRTYSIVQIQIVSSGLPNERIYQMTVANIGGCELKKPIGIFRRKDPDEDGKQFDLVCGCGRLEAYIVLCETKIPAVVIETSPKELAQRAHTESSHEGTTS